MVIKNIPLPLLHKQKQMGRKLPLDFKKKWIVTHCQKCPTELHKPMEMYTGLCQSCQDAINAYDIMQDHERVWNEIEQDLEHIGVGDRAGDDDAIINASYSEQNY